MFLGVGNPAEGANMETVSTDRKMGKMKTRIKRMKTRTNILIQTKIKCVMILKFELNVLTTSIL